MFYQKNMASDVTVMLQSMQELLSLNFTVIEAFDHLVRYPSSAQILPILLDVRKRVHAGTDLASAFQPHVNHIGSSSISLLACAGVSGEMETVLSDIVQHRLWVQSVKRKLYLKLWHPLLTASMMLFAAGFQLVYVVPKASEFLVSQGVVDLSTRWLLVAAFFFQSLLLPAAIMLSVLFLLILALRNYQMELYGFVKRTLLRTLLLERAFRNLGVARYFRTLALMLDNGYGLSQSMEVAERSVGDPYLQRMLSIAKNEVRSGEKFSRAIGGNVDVSQRILSMLSVAEKSAALTSRLSVVSNVLYRESQDAIHRYCLGLVPLCFFLSGIILIWIVFGVFLPMYELTMQMGVS